MKQLYSFFLKALSVSALIFFGTAQSHSATDSEGMPIVYAKGKMSDWAPRDNYKFTRSGSTYYLAITSNNTIEGEFKIGDDNWDIVDFGTNQDNPTITPEVIFPLVKKGENIKGSMKSGYLIFVYTNKDQSYLYYTTATELPDLPEVPEVHDWSDSLPVMFINVYKDKSHTELNNEIIDYNLAHKDYFSEAEYWIDTNGCEWLEDLGAESVGSAEKPLPLQIKARGNWTRIGFSKKPFKLKLDKKQNLLGLTSEKSKHYALLAHADDDNGYLRNFTGFNLGQRIGLPWTPGMQPVEVVINGDYRGLYFLTESIRVGDGRIQISELDDNVSDPELVSGGYVVELDNYDEENQIRMEEKHFVDGQNLDVLRITWDTPEIYSPLQIRFVTDQFTAINNAIGQNSDDLWKYLDLDDAARYYLVNEIVSHTEAYHGSTYLYRDRGENQKWHFSPLWDFGNAFRGHTDNFFYNCDPFGNTWIPSMRENKKFNDKVKETWLWFMQNEYDGIEEDMTEFANHVEKAAQADHQRWKNQGHPEGGQDVADNTNMQDKLNHVKSHLRAKINWLKSQFGDFSAGSFIEPDRDDTEAAPLPEYATTSIQEINGSDVNGETQYYNLQGLRISTPQPGQIYIVKQGNKTFKAIFR